MAHPALRSEPRLWALIIGIDIYKSPNIINLSGAVRDARSFYNYLRGDLGVPGEQIYLLLDQYATRHEIICRLEGFGNDSRIGYGDPIFIFYAGHGARAVAPAGWNPSRIELLVPSDFVLSAGIPDREFGGLINEIARKKGNNITIVLDCCHAGSGTRDVNGGRVRSIDASQVDYHLHREICNLIPDGGPVSGRALQPVGELAHAGSNSHNLVAACKSSELATEVDGQGIFSRALLELLRNKGHSNLRYSEILHNLPSLGPEQHPQCEGLNCDRFIFGTLDASNPAPCRLIEYRIESHGSRAIVLKAGTAHDVSYGDNFAIYPSKDAKHQVGTLFVTNVRPFESSMFYVGASFILPELGFAARISTAARQDLCIAVSRDSQDFINSIIHEPGAELQNIVSQGGGAKIKIEMADNYVTFHPLNIPGGCILPPLQSSYRPGRDEIARILKAMVHYHRQLERVTTGSGPFQNVVVEFFRLAKGGDGFYYPASGHNLYINNQVELEAEPGAVYGINLINTSPDFDFFPNIFYFNSGNFSIESRFQHPARRSLRSLISPSHSVESFLPKKGGRLTIGYGSGGVPPLQCDLPAGRDVDVGYLKIFVFSEPIDQTDITQQTPFPQSSSPRPYAAKAAHPAFRSTPFLPAASSLATQAVSVNHISRSISSLADRAIAKSGIYHSVSNLLLAPPSTMADVVMQSRGLKPYVRQAQFWNAIKIPIIQRRRGPGALVYHSTEPHTFQRGFPSHTRGSPMYPPRDFSPFSPLNHAGTRQ